MSLSKGLVRQILDKIHSGTQNTLIKCLFLTIFFKMNFPFPFDVTDQHALAHLMVYIVYHLCVCTETPVKVFITV